MNYDNLFIAFTKKGMTQTDLQKSAKVSGVTLNRARLGENIQSKVFAKIASALGVDVEYLIKSEV